MPTQTTEEKTIQKVREVLADDSIINAYTSSRVYASHISSIKKPVYPAISLFLLSAKPLFQNPDFVQMSIQIDAWFQNSVHNFSDVLQMQRRIRQLLHRQNLRDTTISVNVANVVEESSGPLMHEEDVDLLHYPMVYSVMANG